MLLGRTANGLYWMQRYIERTENMARLVDAGLRIALTRSSRGTEHWTSVVASAGCADAFAAKHEQADQKSVVDFLLRDTSNPTSVLSAIETARTNARMVRTALTRETWEAVNDAWLTLKTYLAKPVKERELPETLDLIKRQTALVRGAFHSTMLRNEIFDFARLGTFVERADNTARILDVKYYVLLPSVTLVGSALDNYQWESILRSVSAHRAYRWEYEGEYKAANIADFLILNPRMPRSLIFCYRNIKDNLDYLERDYGERHMCHGRCEAVLAKLNGVAIADVFNIGLHEFLADFIRENNDLGADISEAFRFN